MVYCPTRRHGTMSHSDQQSSQRSEGMPPPIRGPGPPLAWGDAVVEVPGMATAAANPVAARPKSGKVKVAPMPGTESDGATPSAHRFAASTT